MIGHAGGREQEKWIGNWRGEGIEVEAMWRAKQMLTSSGLGLMRW